MTIMKNKCKCYRTENKNRYTYHPITGLPIAHNIDVGVCWGTKEMDECSCRGDESKCDFYPEVRERAKKSLVEDTVPCQYCRERNNDFVLLNDTGMYSGVYFEINRQGMLRVRVFNDEMDGFVTQDILNVKYCPMCGREFDN